MNHITNTINRIAISMELRHKQEMLRLRAELSTADREARVQLARRLARLDDAEKALNNDEGIDYLAQARDILNK